MPTRGNLSIIAKQYVLYHFSSSGAREFVKKSEKSCETCGNYGSLATKIYF